MEVSCGSGAPPILQQNACDCLASIIASHFNFICKEKMKVSRPAVFGQPPSAPSQSAKNFTVGGECDVHVARPQFADSVHATALGSIIASHLILICKRNPAETALAGFEHQRSAPQHSVEILCGGGV